MKKKVIAGSLALLAVTAMYAQTYQLPNVGFENWEKAKGFYGQKKTKIKDSQERNLNLGILQISNLLQDGLAPTKNLSRKRKKATMEKPMLMS